MQKVPALLPLFMLLLCSTGCDLSDDFATSSMLIQQPAAESVLSREEPFTFQVLVRSAAPVKAIDVSLQHREGGSRIPLSSLHIPLSLTAFAGVYGEATLDTLLQLQPNIEPGNYFLMLDNELECTVEQNCGAFKGIVPITIE